MQQNEVLNTLYIESKYFMRNNYILYCKPLICEFRNMHKILTTLPSAIFKKVFQDFIQGQIEL